MRNSGAGLERAAGEREGAARRLFNVIFEPDRGAPVIEHASVAERIGPAHAGRRELLPAGTDGFARGIDLEGIEVAGFVDADRLACPVALDQVDLAQPLVAR